MKKINCVSCVGKELFFLPLIWTWEEIMKDTSNHKTALTDSTHYIQTYRDRNTSDNLFHTNGGTAKCDIYINVLNWSVSVIVKQL